MLARYPAAGESSECPPLPVRLRTLAEALLTRKRLGTADLLEKIFIDGCD